MIVSWKGGADLSMWPGRGFGRAILIVAAPLLLACADSGANPPSSDDLLASNVCDRSAGSRWVDPGGEYREAGSFGLAPDEVLIDVWGVARRSGGGVFVFDGGATRVLSLDPALALEGSFGREGRGPGEFTYQTVVPGNWIAAGPSSVYVLDLRVMAEFTPTGEYLRTVTRSPPFPLDVLGLAAADTGVILGYDDIESGTGRRAVHTYRMTADGEIEVLRVDSMPRLPVWQGRGLRGLLAGQGEPLWAPHGRCLFLSDGSGDWILRVDLRTGRADTLHLPHRPIPDRTPEDEAELDRVRRSAAAIGITGYDRVDPTAPMKWVGLIVDPDGYVWLEPWRPLSSKDQPIMALVVDPGTGSVDSVLVKQFPDGFLAAGAFVAVGGRHEVGGAFLTKYSY